MTEETSVYYAVVIDAEGLPRKPVAWLKQTFVLAINSNHLDHCSMLNGFPMHILASYLELRLCEF